MSDRPAWEREGRDWPNREASRFVTAGGLRWHLQRVGEGPVLLLVHGTASATHSWRALMPLLARHFTVVAPDLPGHAFTATPPGGGEALSLPGMARALRALLAAEGVRPEIVVGHSAGAAVLLRLCLDRAIQPRLVVAFNGALVPLGRAHASFFSGAAKVLAGLPFVPQLFAWRAASDRTIADRLLRDTGSTIEPRGVDFYARLLRRSGHVSAALGMMANWDLKPLLRDLPRLQPQLVLVVGDQDRTVPPADARRIKALLPSARIEVLQGVGHLAHEERPEAAADLLVRLAAETTGAGAAP